jgi:TonB family protein
MIGIQGSMSIRNIEPYLGKALLVLGLMFALASYARAQTTTATTPRAAQVPDTPPQAINMLEYRREVGYPPKAKKAGIQGDVVLNVLVDRNGKVISHKVVSTKVDPMLIKAVIDHLSFLQYKPATKDGKPMAQNVLLTVKFRITR